MTVSRAMVASFSELIEPSFRPALSGNSSCGDEVCDDLCQFCEKSETVERCVGRPCYEIPSGQCSCPPLNEETLVAVGAVVLCLILLLLAMALWHWRRWGDFRGSSYITTDFNPTESLLGSQSQNAAEDRDGWSRPTRGRTSLDSAVTCIVCMDVAINCVLMPCAHEVACLRCARRLHLCPVCRTAVDATMKIHVASQEQLLEAALENLSFWEAAIEGLSYWEAALKDPSHWGAALGDLSQRQRVGRWAAISARVNEVVEAFNSLGGFHQSSCHVSMVLS